MTTRLYLVCGLAEVWTCAALRASLSEGSGTDIIVLYGMPISIPALLRSETLAHAGDFYSWARIVDAVDITQSLTVTDTKPSDEARREFKERLGVKTCDVIYTHSPHLLAEQSIMGMYPEARIILFDNGLQSHVTKEIYLGPPDPLKSGKISQNVLDRVVTAYFSLFGDLPIPDHLCSIPCEEIPSDWLLNVARGAVASVSLPHPDLSSALILGTSFYRSNLVTYEEEKRVYLSLIESLISCGEESILYKEHPRANREPLVGKSKSVQHIESPMPVELLPLNLNIHSSYSISSTALLTLKKLFGIPSYTIGRDLPLVSKLKHVRMLHTAVPSPVFHCSNMLRTIE